MCGFNETGSPRIVTKSIANQTNSDLEDGVADKGLGPDGIQEFLFGDELAWTLAEIVQYCEGLGSEFYSL
jgi:hypothetical protein